MKVNYCGRRSNTIINQLLFPFNNISTTGCVVTETEIKLEKINTKLREVNSIRFYELPEMASANPVKLQFYSLIFDTKVHH